MEVADKLRSFVKVNVIDKDGDGVLDAVVDIVVEREMLNVLELVAVRVRVADQEPDVV